MEITSTQREQVLHLLDTYWTKTGCVKCGYSHLELDDRLYELKEFGEEGLLEKPQKTPTIKVTCKQCGNISLIDPTIIGLFDS